MCIIYINWHLSKHCTELHFASFLNGWFITAIVVNPLAKHTSVLWSSGSCSGGGCGKKNSQIRNLVFFLCLVHLLTQNLFWAYPNFLSILNFLTTLKMFFGILKSGILLHKLDYLSILKTFWVYFKNLSLLKKFEYTQRQFWVSRWTRH